jgi:hypothetical protein
MIAEPKENAPDVGPRVVDTVVRGINMIEREAIRPDDFNDDALERMRRLSAFTMNGISGFSVEAPAANVAARVTKRTSANIDVVLAQGYSLGTIEGHLDGLNIHAQPFFTVYDEVTGRAVRCYFDRKVLDRVLDAVGSKVMVHGQIRRDALGRPTQVRPVEFFDLLGLRREPVPSPDLPGVFRGLGDTRSYLEMIRGE